MKRDETAMTPLATALLGLALFAWFLYRQIIARPVTKRDLTLPAIFALILGVRYLNDPTIGISAAMVVFGGAVFGLLTGFLAGQAIRVWRDTDTGIVWQHGGWRYAALFVALLAVRLVARIVLTHAGVAADAVVLNDAFIAIIVGNYLGRAASVGLRALALHGWSYDALPRQRRVR
jgi:hypothetical protein